MCSFRQYIQNKPSKYGIKVHVLADSKTLYLVSSKIYVGACTHAPGLPVATQAVLDLVSSVSGTRRNITTDSSYTSIPLAMELKSRKLTLIGTVKKTKRAFYPAFWRKQMKEQFNTHLTLQTISLCCPLLQRNTRGTSTCPLCIPKIERRYRKRRNKRILQPGKIGVNSHDQMCRLYITARKTSRWTMRLFYGIIDSAALNAFVIFTENVPSFGEH